LEAFFLINLNPFVESSKKMVELRRKPRVCRVIHPTSISTVDLSTAAAPRLVPFANQTWQGLVGKIVEVTWAFSIAMFD
jgi:hypothetical protein